MEYTKIEVVWTVECPKSKKRVDVWPTCRECFHCEATIPSGRPYIICNWEKGGKDGKYSEYRP